MILESKEYFSPQRRVRAYIVAYLKADDVKPSAICTTIACVPPLIKKFKNPAASDMKEFVFGDSHAYVKKELQRRLLLRKKDKGPDGSEEVIQKSNWKINYTQSLLNKGQTVSSCVIPAEARDSPWYATLTGRCQLVLGHAFNNNTDAQFVDCYQSLQREFVSTTPSICTTIVPGSTLWSTQCSRLLLGPELLKFQGMPNAIVKKAWEQKVSDSNMTDLAGNSFTGFVFAAAALAALVHAPLWKAQPGETVISSISSVLDI